jgi:hypothetical protein
MSQREISETCQKACGRSHVGHVGKKLADVDVSTDDMSTVSRSIPSLPDLGVHPLPCTYTQSLQIQRL